MVEQWLSMLKIFVFVFVSILVNFGLILTLWEGEGIKNARPSGLIFFHSQVVFGEIETNYMLVPHRKSNHICLLVNRFTIYFFKMKLFSSN